MVVLGFNSSDDADLAREFMTECGFTFRTVLDSSEAATMTAIRDYKACCVPLHYVIDRERTIALAQPGFEKGYKTILGTLARLGVDTGVEPLPAPEAKRKQEPARRGWEEADAEDRADSSIEKCSLSGKVMDQNHRPVQGARLMVHSGEHSFSRSVRTDGEGIYSLDGLKPGHYAVSLSRRPGRHARSASPPDRSRRRFPSHWLRMDQIGPGQAATIDFAPVKDAASLSGEVLDPEGKPLSGCRVSVNNFSHRREEGFQAFSVRTSTDGYGRFAIDNLNPGTYDATIRKSGEYCRSPAGEIRLENGEAKEIVIPLHPGRINGWIDVEGEIPPGTRHPYIMVTPAGDTFGLQWSTEAYSFSAFEVQNLPPGNYEVVAMLRGFFCEPESFRIEKDRKPDIVEVTLKPAGSVLFMLADKERNPIEHAVIVRIIPGKGEITADMEKLSSGVYRVHSVAIGETLFRIESSGHGKVEKTVTVNEGEEAVVEVQL